MISGLTSFEILSSAEKLDELKKYGALGYDVNKICILLSVIDVDLFKDMFNDENSDIYRIYHQGLYEAEYLVDLCMMEDAQEGKTEAVKRLDRINEHKKMMNIIKQIDEGD